MFSVRLSYLEEEILAAPSDYVYLTALDRILFFNTIVYYTETKDITSLWGTLSTPLDTEFRHMSREIAFDAAVQRRLYRNLVSLGVVKSVAAPWPLAKEDN